MVVAPFYSTVTTIAFTIVLWNTSAFIFQVFLLSIYVDTVEVSYVFSICYLLSELDKKIFCCIFHPITKAKKKQSFFFFIAHHNILNPQQSNNLVFEKIEKKYIKHCHRHIPSLTLFPPGHRPCNANGFSAGGRICKRGGMQESLVI